MVNKTTGRLNSATVVSVKIFYGIRNAQVKTVVNFSIHSNTMYCSYCSSPLRIDILPQLYLNYSLASSALIQMTSINDVSHVVLLTFMSICLMLIKATLQIL